MTSTVARPAPAARSRMKAWAIAAIALFAGAALASCAGVPPPQYQDPLAGLLNQSSAAVPVDAQVKLQQPMVVVLSSNFETYLQYAQKVDKSLKSYGALTNSSAVADVDPKALGASVVAMIKARFADARLVDDLNDALKAGAKSVCVVDLQIFLGARSGDATRVEISTIFLDGQMRPVSKVTGRGAGTIPYPAWTLALQPAIAASLRDIDAKLGALLAGKRTDRGLSPS